MPTYIQISGDPTKWFLGEPFNTSQLKGHPLNLQVIAPLIGTMILSDKHAHVAVLDDPSGSMPSTLMGSTAILYVPTAHGPSEGHLGYELPDNAPPNLAEQIATAMNDGTRLTVRLNGGGTLVLNGATLSFVVITIGPVGEGSPHG
jgi:hypothetical protein